MNKFTASYYFNLKANLITPAHIQRMAIDLDIINKRGFNCYFKQKEEESK